MDLSYRMLIQKAQFARGDAIVHNPPNVTTHTRIIGLVGTHDHKDAAAPSEDGWFLSDFYLFKHLLVGLGFSQAWFTCLEPSKLVEKYKEYAHGNPYGERRVVLDKDCLPDQTTLKVEKESELLSAFTSYLTAECNNARALGHPVLVFIFGHGSCKDHRVFVGWNGMPKVNDGPALTMDHFRAAIGHDVEVCTIMTSCFSGGWAMNQNLNITVLAAAGYERESESWAASTSVSRCSGSIYGSALLQMLLQTISPDLVASTVDTTDPFKVFCSSFEEVLLKKIDRLGACHMIQFSAQDDLWLMPWHSRTGYPLSLYRERWDSLRQLDPQENGDCNRAPESPMITPPAEIGVISLPATSPTLRGRFGNAQKSSLKIVTIKAVEYAQSYPGRGGLWSNIPTNCLVTKCLSGFLQDPVEIERLHCFLIYRETAMDLATYYMSLMTGKGLSGASPKEGFPVFYQWDEDEWFLKFCRGKTEATFRSWSQLAGALFPPPPAWGGRKWYKPEKYIAAACTTAASSGMTSEGVAACFKGAMDWAKESAEYSGAADIRRDADGHQNWFDKQMAMLQSRGKLNFDAKD